MHATRVPLSHLWFANSGPVASPALTVSPVCGWGERKQKDLKELVGAGGRTKKDNGKSMLQQCATDLTEQARLGARACQPTEGA